MAASVDASPPLESVPVVGGPTVPVETVKAIGPRAPLALVVVKLVAPAASGGGPHEIGVWFPASEIVGCGVLAATPPGLMP